MYCRGCWYVLDGLTEHRCPECGRAFDPALRKTYHIKPRGRWWLRIVRRSAAIFLGATALVGGYFYLQHVLTEQALAKLKTAGGLPMRRQGDLVGVVFGEIALGPLDDADLEALNSLAEMIQILDFRGRPVMTDAGLAQVAGLSHLDWLLLDGSPITDAGLEHLKSATRLKHLSIRNTGVTDKGIAELRQALPNVTIQGP